MKPALTALAIQVGRPVHVLGPPGIGKTAFVQALAKKLELHLETFIASTHEPSDINGLPAAVDGFAEFLPTPMIRRILEKHEEGQQSILFLDEISTAPPAMQAGCLRLVHERMAGRVELPDDTWIVLASNPVGTSAGTFLLSAAMANRMLHVEWQANPDDWVEWMLQTGEEMEIPKLPENWREHEVEARTMIASFIGVNKALLLDQPETTDQSGMAWPSPRTWEMASEYLAACLALGYGQEEVLQLLSGVLGSGASLEFINWFDNRDLKRPEEYLANAEKIDLPERSDQVFASLNSIVTYLTSMDKISKEHWKAAWIIMGRVAKDNKADFAALPAKILIKAKPKGYGIPKDIVKFLPALKAAGLIEA